MPNIVQLRINVFGSSCIPQKKYYVQSQDNNNNNMIEQEIFMMLEMKSLHVYDCEGC